MVDKVRSILPGLYRAFHRVVSSWLRSIGYTLIRIDRIPIATLSTIDLLMNFRDPRAGKFRAVQIGSNDGMSDDPLRKHIVAEIVEALLVEPVPESFRKLKQLYEGNESIVVQNVAIANNCTQISLHVPRDRSDSNATQKASSIRGHMQKHGIPDHDIEVINVPAKSVDELLRDCRWEDYDILVCDTEGMDFDIVSDVLSRGAAPDVLFFEVLHMTRIQREEIRTLLGSCGYRFVETLKDCLAVRQRCGSGKVN